MGKKAFILAAIIFIMSFGTFGCGRTGDLESISTESSGVKEENDIVNQEEDDTLADGGILQITGGEVVPLTNGLSAVAYDGDYGFDEFLHEGGASTDAEVVSFLSENVLTGVYDISFGEMSFGCSTISVKDADNHSLFGRNFDWNTCNAMIVQSKPENGYASISTVNTDFISMNGIELSSLPAYVQAIVCLYAPLDGMNEKGLAVSVNMIQDVSAIFQSTDKPDITTTTAIRLLLNQASDVDEAVELLGQYDMHASMGYMMHLALADTSGRSVVVEYINNEMVVTETKVVTNFYLAAGEKNGIGTAQSHERYDILMKALSEHTTMSMDEVCVALDSVSKDNFGEFESTEWSIVFNQSTGEVHYYHRENYNDKYTFKIK
ncbi:MAG: linear amide C-N hydrolase [Clostridium sp.]|nr:linear amide C-N hydrolase [Clostridium sp.]MCM1398347.1 linear amide C-N hydrolase [Clostridium sp.]MCM1458988.1 linear amide C-N hydrolase [Bacteroides sp.]